MKLYEKHPAAWVAFTNMTVLARHNAKREGLAISENNKSMGFEEFLNMMEQEEVVNPNLSREVDKFQKQSKDLQIRMGSNYTIQNEAFNYVEKAYELGIIDPNGMLYKGKA
ncbi:hypothetical protein HXA31_11525 [Salipaludibacillus agaradhaerens]|jgi:hypothetical protein|uniref:Uncharacterized protein n=1 Tax=Salipaludibacillus agaradhaerens TaxID=76935 RepID=A0A9Q4FXJ0_SALAG|nr:MULTISPECIES: hypothetical protein [Salipaludibacillus]MCR6095431.1 hypothetical protein [Salipaludibacillus agaradhaerens]MCR6115009.1 hypothetical protein [Salipaludibacillus agaradhaerens]UTR15700.1 hypothetical protein MM221_03685 [Salipaludibacillus sp. LMS25]